MTWHNHEISTEHITIRYYKSFFINISLANKTKDNHFSVLICFLVLNSDKYSDVLLNIW